MNVSRSKTGMESVSLRGRIGVTDGCPACVFMGLLALSLAISRGQTVVSRLFLFFIKVDNNLFFNRMLHFDYPMYVIFIVVYS